MRGAANAIKTAGGCLLFVACIVACWILVKLELTMLESREEATTCNEEVKGQICITPERR